MAVKKLPSDLLALLTSSLQINSIKHVVEELVYNALDAKANSVAIRIHMNENKLQVIDNGIGITESDFDVLGQKYMTSKCVDLNTFKATPHTYGFRGQFLANIIHVSQKVKITSRSEKTKDTWVKIFYSGKERDIAKTTVRPSIGTTVEISGLFYNLHIKSKAVEAWNELNEIITFLKQLSLVHFNVSISLRDDSKNEIIFKAQKNRDIYQTLSLLFEIDSKDIQEFKVEKSQYKVTALFGKKGKDINPYHWVYLNGKFINNSKFHKIMHDHLIKFSKRDNRNVKTKVAKNKYLESKSRMRYSVPFYIIFVTCPYYDYDVNDTSAKTTVEFKNWQDISNLLEKLIQFYTDDEKLIKKLKPHKNDSNMSKVIKHDTRDQVKKIVEKLLNNNSKKLEISQLQNGVKGKRVKRKIKKKPPNISLSKIIPPRNNTIARPSKEMYKKFVIEKHTLQSPNTSKHEVLNAPNAQAKTTEKNNADFSRTDKRNVNLLETDILMKTQAKEDKHSSVLKSHLKSRRTNYYKPKYIRHITSTNDIDHTLSLDYKKYYCVNDDIRKALKYTGKSSHKLLMGNKVLHNNVHNKKTSLALRKEIEEVVIYDYIPHPLNSTPRYHNQLQTLIDNKPYYSSHDLIKTVLNSQLNVNQRKLVFDINTPDETFQAWNFNFEPSVKYDNIPNELIPPRLTYQSHNYNEHNVVKNLQVSEKGNKVTKFITTQSRDNFFNSINKKHPEINHNKSKSKSKFKKVYSKKHKHYDLKRTSNLHKLHNIMKNDNYVQESSYVIEISKNSTTCFAQEMINNSSRENFRLLNNTNSNKQQTVKSIEETKCLPPVVSNTYTVRNNVSSHLDMGFENYSSVAQYANNFIQETDSITNSVINPEGQNEDSHNRTSLTNTKINENGRNFVFLSNQHKNREIDPNRKLDPLSVCETILKNECISDKFLKINFTQDRSWHNLETFDKNYSEISKQLINEQNPGLFKSQFFLQELSHHFTAPQNDLTASIIASQGLESPKKILRFTGASKEEIKANNNMFVTNFADSIGFTETENGDNEFDGNKKFCMKNRPNFVPKGMSPIFENCQTKSVCDYNIEKDYFENNIYNNFANKIQVDSIIYEPRIDVVNTTTNNVDKINSKLHKENASLIFDGESLKQANVLGQVDGKFIAVNLKAKLDQSLYLVLFDQHAVHERIKLENNLLDYFDQNEWKSTKLDSILLKLSKDEILYLHNYKDKFELLGLRWNILSDCEVSIIGIAEAILGKNPRQVEKVISAVKNLISEEIDVIKSQRGCILLQPKSIMDLVFSEACRYAIKFGDKLSKNDCEELLTSLSECKTPFQCAHGRPVMAVLMDVKDNETTEYKLDVSKLRAFAGRLQKY